MSDKLIIMDNQFKRRRRQTADKENTKKCKIQRATESMMVDHSELTWDQRTTELNKTNKCECGSFVHLLNAHISHLISRSIQSEETSRSSFADIKKN